MCELQVYSALHIPERLEVISDEYKKPAAQEGSLVRLDYETWESFSYEQEVLTMKVLLINGSPHQKGCSYTALSEAASALNEEGVETELYWIGNKPIGGCIGCYQCAKKQKCVFEDKINEFTALAADYDGFIFGSPVYYSGIRRCT